MSFYRTIGHYEYGEQKIEDISTGEQFTACERTKLFSEDFYGIYRFNYATSDSTDKNTEPLYMFLLMPDGYSLLPYVCDYETAKKVILNNFEYLLKGRADTNKIIGELKAIMADIKEQHNSK